MGFGDVKQKDRLFDALARQLGINKEALTEYPNVSKVFGSAEDVYRLDDPKRNYGEAFKRTQEAVGTGLDDVKDPLEYYANMRRIASKDATAALDKDIIKSEDSGDFQAKMKALLNLQHIPVNVTNKMKYPDSAAEYSNRDKLIRLRNPDDQAALLHELGHADVMRKDSKTEQEFQRPLGSLEDVKSAIKEGKSYPLVVKSSEGHYGDSGYLDYPIDKTIELYKKELENRGFERQLPQDNPKFKDLLNIIPTLRRLNR